MRCEEGNPIPFPSNPDPSPAKCSSRAPVRKGGVPLGEDYKSVRAWEDMNVKVQVRAQDGLSSK